MEIYDYSLESDKKKVLSLCCNLLSKNSLVPVIGSGFSSKSPTNAHGTVPLADNLKEEILKYIKKYSGYSITEIAQLEQQSLSEVSGCFWSIYERIPEHAKRLFYDYFSINFINISCFKPFQKNCCKIHWPCVFTLNYDTLLEDGNPNYRVIIPFDRINKSYTGHRCSLYKLHGDAEKFINTGDKKYCILSRKQYVESMNSHENEDLLEELQTVFSSKSVIFIGCGLDEELDLLYIADTNLSERSKNIDKSQQAIIYINYEPYNTRNEPLSPRIVDKLNEYNVTTVIRIASEDELNYLFQELLAYSTQIPNSSIETHLRKYTSFEFIIRNKTDKANRSYLFQDILVRKSILSHTIILPGFFILRDISNVVIKDIDENNNFLHFISGSFFSGKTYCLLGIAQHYTKRKVYFFPSSSNVSVEELDCLLAESNTIVCFDSNTLEFSQVKHIASEKIMHQLKKQNLHIIIMIEKSDASFYKYYFSDNERNDLIKIYSLDNHLNDHSLKSLSSEILRFNESVGILSFPPYNKTDSLLDYVVNNERELIADDSEISHYISPDFKILSQDTINRLSALIMLATEVHISAKRSIQFHIANAIDDLVIKCQQPGKQSSVIERDYSSHDMDSSGFEYVCNSKYWITRTLSLYAINNPKSADAISNAYLNIINVYRALNPTNNIDFYRSSEPYYYFDHIQALFNYKWYSNASSLMNSIYDSLMSTLSGSYQFLHQKAKGKLVVAQVQMQHKHYSMAKQTLDDAILNIDRAIALAEAAPNAKNIDATLLHMKYTKGRIMIQRCSLNQCYFPQAVNACYEVYQSGHNSYDFLSSTGSDLIAFNWFKRSLLSINKPFINYPDFDKSKAEYLLLRWTGKHIYYSK